MTKQTKTILGVGALALVGYFVYKQMGTKANASGKKRADGCVETRVSNRVDPKYKGTRLRNGLTITKIVNNSNGTATLTLC